MIGERYGTATVVIAEAVVDPVTLSGQRNVSVSLRYLGGPWSDQTDIRIFRIENGETVAAALSRIALATSIQIEEDWKRDNILQLDSSDKLIADVVLGELREWVEMRRRLEGVAFLQNSQLVMISRTRASVRLTYFGNPEQLQTALAQRDIVLERGAVNWVLRDAREPATPAWPGSESAAPVLSAPPKLTDLGPPPEGAPQ